LAAPAALHNVWSFDAGRISARFGYAQQRGRPYVDLALRLNALAVVAAFAFVGAILFGAF
jgi:hypothetical protein